MCTIECSRCLYFIYFLFHLLAAILSSLEVIKANFREDKDKCIYYLNMK